MSSYFPNKPSQQQGTTTLFWKRVCDVLKEVCEINLSRLGKGQSTDREVYSGDERTDL